ncbi:MAG: PAS domain S-box protein [Anaerolineae bacterium]|nr:PAS domain S-box protein [Anaerolineae bacterium]
MLRRFLEAESYSINEVDVVSNVLTLAPRLHPDVIILSATRAGLDACTLLRTYAACPILLVAEDDQIDAAIASGANDVLTRPLRQSMLSFRIRRLLEIGEVEHLRLRESWYRSLIENASQGVFRSSYDGRYLMVNKGLVRMLGYENEAEVYALNIATDVFVNPQRRHELQTQYADISDFIVTEALLKRKNGEVFPASIYSRVVAVPAGETLYYEGFIFDVTEQVRAKESEHQQRLLAETLRAAAAALNSTLETEVILDRLLASLHRVLPYDVATIFLIENGIARTTRLKDFTNPELEAQMRVLRMPVMGTPHLRQMVETRRPIWIADSKADPDWVDFPETSWIRSMVNCPICLGDEVIGFLNLDSATPNTFGAQHAEQLSAFASQAAIALQNARLYEAVLLQAEELGRRVTERTVALEQQRAQLQAVLESMGEGVIGITVADGGQVRWYVNRAMRVMSGYENGFDDLAVLKSQTMTDNEFNERYLTMLEKSFKDGISYSELPLRRRDGSDFTARLTVSSVNNSDGVAVGTVMIVRDISEEKALEARKSRFVANVSHDLRTPITNLKARLYLLRRQPEKFETHLNVLDQITEQMHELVENLLDLTRFERGIVELHVQELPLQAFIRDLAHMYEPQADQKGVRLASVLPDYPTTIMADAARLRQVFTNLTTNALHHTASGGQVTLRLHPPNGEFVTIDVEDTGEGIAPEHLTDIFRPFYRARYGGAGMGLGLSIAKEIIELHGGQIAVSSEIGKGTTFSVRLKLRSPNGTVAP